MVYASVRCRNAFQVGIVAGNTEQAQADHQHTGDGTALEGDVKRRTDAVARRFRGAHVGTHRHVHADETCRAG